MSAAPLSAIARFDRLTTGDTQRIVLPEIRSFADFLAHHARAKDGSSYISYGTEGREVIAQIIAMLDDILGVDGAAPLTDADFSICGGAQWGKTVLVLNLIAYLLGVKFMSSAYYLPDKDLVDAIVDGKLRPDVLEQIEWLAQLIQVGKSMSKTGKQVNRKGALLCTDGKRTALGYFFGLNKVPTSITADVVIVDERDDVNAKNAKYLKGRLTSSKQRTSISIGTMRIHGAGQNQKFAEGTQHIEMLTCPACTKQQNPEDHWPGICRLAVDGRPCFDDPRLGYEGDFRTASGRVYVHDLTAHYYLGCVECGAELDRHNVCLVAQFPERGAKRKWSVRVSQLGMAAIDLVQVVADWCDNAVKDPEAMVAFCCDRLAKPKNTSQKLTPGIIERCRRADFTLSLQGTAGMVRFGGLDMGDRCWFTARERHSQAEVRMIWLEQIALGRVLDRVPQLFDALGMSCLFVDSRPDAATSRTLVQRLNGLLGRPMPKTPEPEKAYLSFSRDLAWDGEKQLWRGLRAAVVEFALKDGQGIRHKLGITDDGQMYPIIQCSRDQAIQRVINEFLTVEDGVVEVIDGEARLDPAMRLPGKTAGSPAALQVFEDHCLVGSQKEADTKGIEHFVDKVENHYLLSDAYSGLAELVGGQIKRVPFAYEPVRVPGSGERIGNGEGVLL